MSNEHVHPIFKEVLERFVLTPAMLDDIHLDCEADARYDAQQDAKMAKEEERGKE